MEINELKYFLATAQTENVNRASEKLSISPGSISKAIAKLERELGVSLFERVGRQIKITTSGRLLQKRAAKILSLTESTAIEIGGRENEFHVLICGDEALLSKFGVDYSQKIQAQFPGAFFELVACSPKEAQRKVRQREAHIGLSSDMPSKEFSSKKIDKIRFETCVSDQHPLYKGYRRQNKIHVSQLLQHRFVTPSHQILGKTGEHQSFDGWREDKFPRKIGYKATSLNAMMSWIHSGDAIAYLPSFLVEENGFVPLNVEGCPYYCEQTIYRFSREPEDNYWLNQVW